MLIYLWKLSDKNKKKIKTYHDETRIVSIPPTEWWDTDFWNFPCVQHFTSTMSVPTENQTGLKPP